jgi:hypothetical protein
VCTSSFPTRFKPHEAAWRAARASIRVSLNGPQSIQLGVLRNLLDRQSETAPAGPELEDLLLAGRAPDTPPHLLPSMAVGVHARPAPAGPATPQKAPRVRRQGTCASKIPTNAPPPPRHEAITPTSGSDHVAVGEQGPKGRPGAQAGRLGPPARWRPAVRRLCGGGGGGLGPAEAAGLELELQEGHGDQDEAAQARRPRQQPRLPPPDVIARASVAPPCLASLLLAFFSQLFRRSLCLPVGLEGGGGAAQQRFFAFLLPACLPIYLPASLA